MPYSQQLGSPTLTCDSSGASCLYPSPFPVQGLALPMCISAGQQIAARLRVAMGTSNSSGTRLCVVLRPSCRYGVPPNRSPQRSPCRSLRRNSGLRTADREYMCVGTSGVRGAYLSAFLHIRYVLFSTVSWRCFRFINPPCTLVQGTMETAFPHTDVHTNVCPSLIASIHGPPGMRCISL